MPGDPSNARDGRLPPGRKTVQLEIRGCGLAPRSTGIGAVHPCRLWNGQSYICRARGVPEAVDTLRGLRDLMEWVSRRNLTHGIGRYNADGRCGNDRDEPTAVLIRE